MGVTYTTVQTWTVTNPGVYYIKYSALVKNNGAGYRHTVICDIWKGSVGANCLGSQREQVADNGGVIQTGQTVTVTGMVTLAAGDTVYVTAAAYNNIIWFEEGQGFIQQIL